MKYFLQFVLANQKYFFRAVVHMVYERRIENRAAYFNVKINLDDL